MMRKRPGRFQTPPGPALLAAASLLAGACDASWGGTRVTVEEWSSEPEQATGEEAAPEPEARPLPEGPLLFVVRPDTSGRALMAPAARLATDGPAAPGWPAGPWGSYRARLDSAFLTPGEELTLLAAGEIVGSVAIGPTRSVPDSACPSVAAGRLLVAPGSATPSGVTFAVARPDSAALPRRYAPTAPDRNTRVFSGVLVERILEDAGVAAPAGLRRIALSALRFGGDTRPGIAASYLAGDTAAPGAPAGEALSLAFLSRYDPAAGYVPIWWDLRRYSTAGEKLVLEHLEWIRAPSGRVDLYRAHDGTGTRLAALPWRGREAPVEGGLWVEAGRCPAFALLQRAAGEGD